MKSKELASGKPDTEDPGNRQFRLRRCGRLERIVIQVAVDAKNKMMIVDQEVTNQVVDMGLLTQTALSRY